MSKSLNKTILIATLNGLSLVSTLMVQLLFVKEVESDSFSDNIFLMSSLGMFVISIFSSTLGVYLIENFSKIKDEELNVHVFQIYKKLWAYLLFAVILMLAFCLYLSFKSNINLMVLSVHVLVPIFIFHSSIITAIMYSRGRILTVEVVNFIGAIIPVVILISNSNGLGDVLLSLILILKAFICLILFQMVIIKKKYFSSKKLNISFVNSLDGEARKVLKTSMLFKSESFIDKFVVSFMPDGMLTLFHLLTSIANGVMSIYSKVVTIPLSYSVSINKADYKLKLYSALNTWRIMVYSLIGIIIIVFVLVFSFKITFVDNDIIGYYSILVDNIFMVSALLLAYIFMAKNQIYSVLLYSRGLPIKAIEVGMVSFFINVTQKIVLFLLFSISGFYLAYVLGQFVTLKLFENKVKSNV
ncbi:hypothetical protein [Colwellia echini]|uniref:Uncharacterized protein n=1 Tax=Colwellia echini TaxID=1982103 RepID=A0ABY3MUH3_9GAMM|nr:hypothetical protein [Colwellia echini]TYK64717.1 hypothetical protein CWS31_014175 [Colwellia echini]